VDGAQEGLRGNQDRGRLISLIIIVVVEIKGRCNTVVGLLVVAGLKFFHKGAPIPVVVYALPCSGVFNDICIACLLVVAEGAADLQGECRAGLHHLLVETGSLLAAQFSFVTSEEPGDGESTW
jgi:hypothetical protein